MSRQGQHLTLLCGLINLFSGDAFRKIMMIIRGKQVQEWCKIMDSALGCVTAVSHLDCLKAGKQALWATLEEAIRREDTKPEYRPG